MSVQYNADAGSDDFHYYASGAPDATTFCVAAWVRMDTLPGSNAMMLGPDNNSGAGTNRYKVTASYNAGSRLEVANETTVANGNDAWVDDAWRYVVLYRSGANPNGVLGIKWLEDGETTFSGPATLTGLTALTPSLFGINCHRSSASGVGAICTVAFIKVWSGVIPSDADLLTERLYRNIQTNLANDWALWKFLTGALTTDSSGNGRTLTANGAPAFVSAEPVAVLGDDPTTAAVSADLRMMPRGLGRGLGRGLA